MAAERVEPWGLPRPLPREPGASAGSPGFYRGGAAGRGFPEAGRSEGGGRESASRAEGRSENWKRANAAGVTKRRWPQAKSWKERDTAAVIQAPAPAGL